MSGFSRYLGELWGLRLASLARSPLSQPVQRIPGIRISGFERQGLAVGGGGARHIPRRF